MKSLFIFLLLQILAFGQDTKVGGSGKTKVGGSGKTKVNAVVQTGPNTYYNTTVTSDTSFATGGGYMDWSQPFTISVGGHVTKLQVHQNDCSDTEDIKVAVFDSATGNAVSGASGTFSATTSANNGTYLEITGLSAAISSGTYRLGITASGTGFRVDALTSAGAGSYANGIVFASFPPSTLPTPAGTEGSNLRGGAFVGP